MNYAILALLASIPAHADFHYPVLNDYQTQATALVQATQSAISADDLVKISRDTETLIQTGVLIMDLYGSKNPKCAEQYAAFGKDLPTMESLSLDQVNLKYHNGTGLPVAPRHCYFGRSEIVHPVMNVIRLKGAFTEAVKAEVLDDFNEVIEHLAKIQSNLDNPPN